MPKRRNDDGRRCCTTCRASVYLIILLFLTMLALASMQSLVNEVIDLVSEDNTWERVVAHTAAFAVAALCLWLVIWRVDNIEVPPAFMKFTNLWGLNVQTRTPATTGGNSGLGGNEVGTGARVRATERQPLVPSTAAVPSTNMSW